MTYWLMKSEPSAYSIDDLKREGQTHWDGIRNYQARNYMREMQVGDEAFFYHSNCTPPGIVGTMKVVKTVYLDHTAFDPEDIHFDPKSKKDQPRWEMVDLAYLSTFPKIISLAELRAEPTLSTLVILRKGNRLSITPLVEAEWRDIFALSM